MGQVRLDSGIQKVVAAWIFTAMSHGLTLVSPDARSAQRHLGWLRARSVSVPESRNCLLPGLLRLCPKAWLLFLYACEPFSAIRG